MMIRWRLAWRNVLRHPWLTVLAIVGVSLGVAVVTAVDLANHAAERAFTLAAQTVAGRATHQVVGGPTGLPEELYERIRLKGIRRCAPVVTGTLQLKRGEGATFQLIGVDPFAEPPIRSFSADLWQPGLISKLIATPNTVLLLRQTAQELGVRPGDQLPAVVGAQRRHLLLAGLLDPPDQVTRLGLASVLVSDISTAQEVLGMTGRLSRIDLIVPEGAAGKRLLAQVQAMLPPEASIVAAGARAGALERMTRAFRLNLTALSLLALVVGMFLIYNTMTFSVIRRRRLIGMLRALGVTRREVFAMIWGEALLIGLAGTTVGIIGGDFLGEQLTRLVTRTINDLYFVLEVRRMPLSAVALAKGAFLGIAATLAAACPAALEATGAPPRAVLSRSAIEARQRQGISVAVLSGAILILGGGALLLAPVGGIPAGFAGLFAVIVGYALLVPGAVVLFVTLVRPAVGALFGIIGKMAARGVVVALSRTGVATAALVVAVAAGIGVGIMVGGFRLTVQSWLESWLQADVYVRSADNSGGRSHPPLDPRLVQRLAGVAGLRDYSLSRRVTVEGPGGATELLSMQMPRESFLRYPFKKGDPLRAWQSFSRGQSVVVSEPYSYRHRLRLGDSVSLRTSAGEVFFPISAIIYDYGSDTGIVLMSRVGYLKYFRDQSVDGMGFYAENRAGSSRLVREIGQAGRGSRIAIISNGELKRATMAVFDRTFAITGVLRMLTMLVAFVGILAALMAMQVERARELAVLRAVGLTPGQVWGVICGETALIGAIAGLLSLPLGIIEALVLVYVVNLRSFGWTMQFTVEPAYLVEAMLLSVSAAILAGIYPSAMIARTSPAQALKEE